MNFGIVKFKVQPVVVRLMEEVYGPSVNADAGVAATAAIARARIVLGIFMVRFPLSVPNCLDFFLQACSSGVNRFVPHGRLKMDRKLSDRSIAWERRRFGISEDPSLEITDENVAVFPAQEIAGVDRHFAAPSRSIEMSMDGAE